MSKLTEGMYTVGYGLKTREIPTFCQLLDLQPLHDRAEIARNLGISYRTMQRYEADNNAPRAVMLALYHESSYGIEQRHLQLFNAARMQAQLAASLDAAFRRSQAVFDLLFSRNACAANSPIFYSQLELFEMPAISDSPHAA